MDKTRPEPIIVPQTKKNVKDNTIILKIIKQKVNFNLYTDIIKECNSNLSWQTLQ